jgi:hypothetical protein
MLEEVSEKAGLASESPFNLHPLEQTLNFDRQTVALICTQEQTHRSLSTIGLTQGFKTH